jgi:hypothetical protein
MKYVISSDKENNMSVEFEQIYYYNFPRNGERWLQFLFISSHSLFVNANWAQTRRIYWHIYEYFTHFPTLQLQTKAHWKPPLLPTPKANTPIERQKNPHIYIYIHGKTPGHQFASSHVTTTLQSVYQSPIIHKLLVLTNHHTPSHTIKHLAPQKRLQLRGSPTKHPNQQLK